MDEKLIEMVRAYNELYDTTNRGYCDHHLKERIWTRIGEDINKTGKETKVRWISLRDQYRRYVRKNALKGIQEPTGKTRHKYADEMAFVKPFLRGVDKLTHVEDDEVSEASEDCIAIEEDDVLQVPPKKQRCSDGGDESFTEEKWPVQENQCEAIKKSVRIPLQRIVKPPETSSSWSMQYNTVDKASTGSMKYNAVDNTNGLMKYNAVDNASSGLMKYNTVDKASSGLMKYNTVDNEKDEKPNNPVDLFFQTMAATVKRFSPYNQNVCKTKVFSVVSELEMEQILEFLPPTATTP